MGKARNERVNPAVAREHLRLRAILDRSPHEAVAEARRVQATPDLSPEEAESIRAAVFVDAGECLRDPAIVGEGVEVFRRMRAERPDCPLVAYNLANGLRAQATTHLSDCRPWFLATSDLRKEARSLLQWAARTANDPYLSTQARTNLANLLLQSFRWAEAYDSYRAALRSDPANGVASSGIAKVIQRFIDRGIGDPDWLKRLASKYMRMALASGYRIEAYAGEPARRSIESLEIDAGPSLEPPDLTHASEYARFVAQHGLALSLTLEGLDPDERFWDSLVIPRITEPVGSDHGVPPIFAMWNVLKADYLAARWLAFLAHSGKAPESGSYSDTLDYANYGIQQSLWTIAQKAALDVLDKIAVAATEYLKLPGPSKRIHFRNRWHVSKDGQLLSPRQWQPEVQKEIAHGNTALVALSELAEDVFGGFLADKKDLRHASTHRFVVLHERGREGSRTSEHVERHNEGEFETLTLETLQVVRSALFYFLEMIVLSEGRKVKQGGIALPLTVPPHHWIRGDGTER